MISISVAPAELEGLLLTNPDIADAAVIGIPDREQETELPRYAPATFPFAFCPIGLILC
jgi:acyl-CoA synthetase (AMP-forming)/AMP-acid ligase II